MNEIQKFLEENNLRKIDIAKIAGVRRSTISDITRENKKLERQSIRTVEMLALATNKSPGEVLNSLIRIRERDEKNGRRTK